jgi:hypothetical protein
MKRALLSSLLFLLTASLLPLAASAADKPEYNIKIHVSSSELVLRRGLEFQYLTVLIDGKHYRLINSRSASGLLRLGDYQARLVRETAPAVSEYDREYELLFADGKSAKFNVVGESE